MYILPAGDHQSVDGKPAEGEDGIGDGSPIRGSPVLTGFGFRV